MGSNHIYDYIYITNNLEQVKNTLFELCSGTVESKRMFRGAGSVWCLCPFSWRYQLTLWPHLLLARLGLFAFGGLAAAGSDTKWEQKMLNSLGEHLNKTEHVILVGMLTYDHQIASLRASCGQLEFSYYKVSFTIWYLWTIVTCNIFASAAMPETSWRQDVPILFRYTE